jgi:rod shape-determining protein MreC
MRNLILLFIRYGAFFLFILLESICFYLIVQFNESQQAIYVNSVNNFTGRVDAMYTDLDQYLDLRETNDSLAQANAWLMQLSVNGLLGKEIDLDSMALDTATQQFVFTTARVVRNSVNRHHNYLMIDKGREDGVEPHMGVVTEKGIVGVVRDVSDHFSLVMSLLHRESHPGAAIRRNKYFGSLSWAERSPREVQLNNIPKHAKPMEGDTVETSGFSFIYPPGIPVGKIEAFSLAPGSDTYEIDVELFIDLANIEYVYVVKNRYRQQQIELAQQAENE